MYKDFEFRGGALTCFGTSLLCAIIVFFTLGLCTPWAITIFQKWQTRNTYVEGRQLKFIGGGWSLIGRWIKWWFFTLITCGIYSFWIYPDLQKWIANNTKFA